MIVIVFGHLEICIDLHRNQSGAVFGLLQQHPHFLKGAEKLTVYHEGALAPDVVEMIEKFKSLTGLEIVKTKRLLARDEEYFF